MKLLQITKWGYRDGVKSQDRDGLYTWCSRTSDRIT